MEYRRTHSSMFVICKLWRRHISGPVFVCFVSVLDNSSLRCGVFIFVFDCFQKYDSLRIQGQNPQCFKERQGDKNLFNIYCLWNICLRNGQVWATYCLQTQCWIVSDLFESFQKCWIQFLFFRRYLLSSVFASVRILFLRWTKHKKNMGTFC